jgi:hypothetical protein
MVISAIGRIAAKAAMKKISDASAKKARAVNKANLKKTDFKAIEAMKTAEGTERISRSLKKFKLPTAAGEPGKFRESVNSAVSKKNKFFFRKTTWNVIKNQFRSFVKSKSKKKSTRCFRSF